MTTFICDNCGSTVFAIWGGDDIRWTGKCLTCLYIYMFLSKDEVNHKESLT